MTTLSDVTIDNLLVEQKNQILALLRSCEDLLGNKQWQEAAADYLVAISTINVLRDLWIASNYGYKANELLARIHNRINFAIQDTRPSKARSKLVEIAQLTTEIRIKGIHADFAMIG